LKTFQTLQFTAMSAPSSDPPSQPPTEGNSEKHEPTEASTTAAPAADAAPTSTGDVEMKQEEEKVDRFDDVPEHVLEVGGEVACPGPCERELMLLGVHDRCPRRIYVCR
jgi:hypothetical protein